MNTKFLTLAMVLVASAAFAQEDPGFGPPPADRPPMIQIGSLYFYAPETCVVEGEFRNSPEAVVRLRQVRCAAGRTYVYGVAQKEQLFFLAGPSSFNSASTRLKVLTGDPALIQLEKGETFSIIMEGEHDQFQLVDMLPEDKVQEQETAEDGGNAPLFESVPRNRLPSSIQPQWKAIPIPSPYGDEPYVPGETEDKKAKPPVRLDGPIAGEDTKKRS